MEVRMPFQHPHVNQQTIDWVNKHGTFEQPDVDRLLPVASTSGDKLARWQRIGEVCQAVVQYAFDHTEPLRPDGSRWSLSNIGVPTKLALSLAAHDVCEQLPGAWVSQAYRAQLEPADMTPMLVSGSMQIHRLNRTLAIRNLALQTSGASDGQTLAGACATGTHGAAVRIGALHDTVRAVHLMTEPHRAVLVQPASAPLTAVAAQDLTFWLGFPTELVSNDTLFHASLVHLGSLGLVLNMVVETVPLYYLDRVSMPHLDSDAAWKTALRTPGASIPAPYHFEVVLNPYRPLPGTEPRAWVISMHAAPFSGQPDVEVRSATPVPPNPDLLHIVSHLLEVLDSPLSTPTFRRRMTKQLVELYGRDRTERKALPGVMFGPTGLPEGRGDSIEFALDAQHALAGVEIILDTLTRRLRRGEQFAGGIGVRFVRRSEALLAPSIPDPTCFIELPGLRTNEVRAIFGACGAALDDAGIGFGCHWGQTHLNTPERVTAWWGNRAQQWRSARQQLLPDPTARTVFASPLLADCGLA
jgi:hypothetical protein